MRIGASLVLIAVGAILAFAINVNNSHGFNINTAGIILMVVGALGLLVSLVWMSTHRTDAVLGAHGQRRTTVVDETAEPRY
ncbi:MAG TPA: hypothetical protein VHS54_10270 [Jatrophihabitans sp.]|jgi:hypothetical protein|nr:hypothetical protein [Jatrophihabitans sp.]